MILFAPDPLSNLNEGNIFSFDETDIWEDISKALDSIGASNFNFLLKLHPNQNISNLSKCMIEFPVSNSVIINSTDLNSLIYHSDIIIGMFSSLLVEASLFGKKILRHIPKTKTTDPLQHLNIGEKSNNVNELVKNLKNSIKQLK
jgi:CDP-glycerol glycerophosphotransferase (TagB/SpsB family)